MAIIRSLQICRNLLKLFTDRLLTFCYGKAIAGPPSPRISIEPDPYLFFALVNAYFIFRSFPSTLLAAAKISPASLPAFPSAFLVS